MTPGTAAGSATTPSLDDGPAGRDAAAERAVARLRPGLRRSPGLVEGFVPIELAAREPRTLRAADAAPLPPPVEAGEAWPDRETLFGEL